MATPYPEKPMHRIAYTRLGSEQIAERLKPVVERGARSVSVLATDLVGKRVRIVTDEGMHRVTELSAAASGRGLSSAIERLPPPGRW